MANLKAWYYVHELAVLSEQEGWRLRRFLKKNHADILHRNGQDYFVYLHDLQNTLDGLWQSILTMEALKSSLSS